MGGDGQLVFSHKHPHSFTQMFPQCIEMRGAQSGPAHEFKCQVHLSGQLALHICAALSLLDADLYVEVQTASCPSSLVSVSVPLSPHLFFSTFLPICSSAGSRASKVEFISADRCDISCLRGSKISYVRDTRGYN